METKDIIYELRMKHQLSQDELAKRVFVTRQAVSRWENGETIPNTETLKLLSKEFQVSIDTLLGTEHKECLEDEQYTLKYLHMGGKEKFNLFRQQLIHEINVLRLEGMPEVEKLHVLPGDFVNYSYRLPNGENIKFLKDDEFYLGCQLECEFDETSCFGVVASLDFILICSYDEYGENQELLLYKHR